MSMLPPAAPAAAPAPSAALDDAARSGRPVSAVPVWQRAGLAVCLCAAASLPAAAGRAAAVATRPTPGAAPPAATVFAPLVDDVGLPMPSVALPRMAVRAPRTVHYATRTQARWFEQALGGAAVTLDLDAAAAASASGVHAHGALLRALAAEPLAEQPAVLVRGDDLPAAVRLASSLDAAGLRRVWVVLP